ncbi:riboflavin biosynthesis protein [Buchnera aphidicola (Nipponaphis monzeni)]|uniref:Riboflavin biosynthesis protein RibD n=1 Tax=Buchnera aphidicola (Nipponaphis monzeni) TaxID=2495405 RepID=A0A455TAK6_9GAMM|nr:bifunctional diaminohydroxyphosphoribosylaminopyrimidine deaminase/5-amino-6-(5-phosphoribosylamino)uracil reductase RibD [Buchnera aphidicola]BBI01352.1 riboflavin biosynthesis protein [Buchnera aphidicola (Nipponaphis monzeni)]
MKKAIELAKKGEFTTAPNPNVGCIIVNNNEIVGQGWHCQTGKEHAEIIALNMAGSKAIGSTMYVTLEPCSNFGHTPPCFNIIKKSGITKIVIATQDPNPLNSGKSISFLANSNIQVKINILANESKKINKGFFKRMETGLPFVQLKLGASIDGRTATVHGHSKWITSIQSRKDVQYYRAKSSAILSSSNTILNDNPYLTVRLEEIDKTVMLQKEIKNTFKQPIRIIIDSQNKIKNNYNCINQQGNVFLIRTKKDCHKWPANVQQIIVKATNKKIDLKNLFLLLGTYQINNIWVEAGPTLSGLLIEKKIIDELIIYISPKILGHTSKPLFIIEKTLKLPPNFIKLSFTDVRKIGPDIRITIKPIYL